VKNKGFNVKAKLICAVLVITLCSSSFAKPSESALVSKAKEAIREQMKDPASVEFRNVILNAKSGAVCGEVNAKNSFGGYTGFTQFAFGSDGSIHIVPSTISSADFDSIVRAQKALPMIEKLCGADEGKAS
jgi:hypothetical protein